ncbi:MAG TPA: hypothetical protein VFZ95_14300 [Steroidobacteraceae bacterium]
MDPRQEVDRPGGMRVAATLLLVTASWLSYLTPILIDNFGGTYEALGTKLSGPTRFLVSMPRLWLVFVVLAVPLFIWVIARSRVTREELGRMKLALRLMTVVMVLACGLAAWALYIPILKRGELM